MRTNRRIILLLLSAVVVLLPAAEAAADDTPNQQVFVQPVIGRKPVVSKVATLPSLDLKQFQNANLPGTISNDRGLHVGSVGSGMFRAGDNQYWMVTDRGPTTEVGDRKTFLVPRFTPALVLAKVSSGGGVSIQQSIPLTTKSGKPVTGLPNFARSGDPAPYAGDAKTRIGYNANGLDTEGVVRTADGHFWLVDEYGPSIVEVDASGHVLRRHVPSNLADDYKRAGVSYPVKGSLSSELAKRKTNRGFEGIALLPDGKTVVVALQSALTGGDKDALITKLLTFDTSAGRVKHTYSYRFDKPSTFGGGTRGRDLKISALVPVDGDSIIVQERTDDQARFRLITLNPKNSYITETDKRTVANLAGVNRVPGKLEGAALKDRSTLVVSSDDDFGFVSKAYKSGQNVKLNGVKTRVIEVKLR